MMIGTCLIRAIPANAAGFWGFEIPNSKSPKTQKPGNPGNPKPGHRETQKLWTNAAQTQKVVRKKTFVLFSL